MLSNILSALSLARHTSTSSHEQVEKASAICAQAIVATKLTPNEFWAKFGTAVR